MTKRRLSGQQKRRIHELQQARLARTSERAERRAQRLEASGLGPEQGGRVRVNFGSTLVVEDAAGRLVTCSARQNLGPIVCGDRVAWQASPLGEGVVSAVAPRQGCLLRPDARGELRPIAANLDRLVLVIAPRPPFDEAQIDRYLVAAELTGIPATLLLNKVDLLDPGERSAADARLAGYQRVGYPLLHASCASAHGLDELRAALAHGSSILLGQSGVGKSSLVNHLVPGRDVRTGELSATGAQGTHTTSATTLYHLPGGGELIDSPGVWEFSPPLSDPEQLAHGFVEFRAHLGRCRFSNCRHASEPGCALQQAVDDGEVEARRLASYRALRSALESGR
ncbi:MAG TPA: small ribosomal subunit biogenesis GTPase RsgA [Gammaproteobacteria bacterium]